MAGEDLRGAFALNGIVEAVWMDRSLSPAAILDKFHANQLGLLSTKG